MPSNNIMMAESGVEDSGGEGGGGGGGGGGGADNPNVNSKAAKTLRGL